jgi:hypothetical protein
MTREGPPCAPRRCPGAPLVLLTEIIYRFGGAYVDGDNTIGRGFVRDLRAALRSPAGYAMHHNNNDLCIAPAGHPAFAEHLRHAPERYTLDQEQLPPDRGHHQGQRNTDPAHRPDPGRGAPPTRRPAARMLAVEGVAPRPAALPGHLQASGWERGWHEVGPTPRWSEFTGEHTPPLRPS